MVVVYHFVFKSCEILKFPTFLLVTYLLTLTRPRGAFAPKKKTWGGGEFLMKKILVKKIFGEKNIWLKKFCQKNFWSKKLFSKKISEKKIWSNKIPGQKNSG